MPRIHWTVVAAVAMCLVGAPGQANAEASLAFLVQQLKTSDDYRVRTQAALALGSSGADGAVAPLCEALGDANASVKVAAAAALGKLAKPASLPCLKGALGKGPTPPVRAQIEKAIAGLERGGSAGGGGAPPDGAVGPGTKYYVAIQITNKSGRSNGDIDGSVRGTVRSKLAAAKAYALAPAGETPAQGGQVVKSRNLKGYFLIVTVDPPVYAGTDLTQAVRVSMWTYPDKSLQGEFSPKLTQSDTKKGDTESENDLVKMCVENALETFKKIVASM